MSLNPIGPSVISFILISSMNFFFFISFFELSSSALFSFIIFEFESDISKSFSELSEFFLSINPASSSSNARKTFSSLKSSSATAPSVWNIIHIP